MVGSETEATVMLNVVPGLNTGITAFNAGLSSINAQFQNVTDAIGSTFGMVDSMIVSSGLMLAQFGMGAANAFGEFEQGMQIVKAVSQQSGQAMAYLKQEAQNFSVQYRTDIDDITAGLQTLGRAGLNSAQEQTEVLEQGLQTAKLEGRELNGVLEEIIQNTTLLGGDIKSDQFGEQSGYLNDLLVGTSLSAPIDTHDISETLKYSGGMLAAAGGTIATDEGYANEQGRALVEDYMGAVAAFAQKGVKGSIAGTALRAFFNKPATQDKSVVEALEEIGMAPEDLWNDEETMKPVSEQIGLIQTQMEAKGVSKMDQMQLWSKIVGGKMGQQMMKLDAQDIREMTTDIQQSSSARDLAEQTFNTYNQQMNKFSEEGQKAFREFGEHIVTVVRPALDILTRLMDLLSNPVVSFGGFIVFTTVLSHALQAIGRIAGRVKDEINWLIEGRSNFNPMAMLDNANKGQFQKPYLDIVKSSDKDRYLTGDMRTWMPFKKEDKKEKSQSKAKDSQQKVSNYFNAKTQGYQKISQVHQNLTNSIKSTTEQISQNITNLFDKVNKDFDGLISNISQKIKSLDINVDIDVQELEENIANLNSVVNETATKVENRAKQVTDKIKADIEEIRVAMTQTPISGQPIPDWDGAVSEDTLKGRYSKAELQAILDKNDIKYRKNDNKSVLSKLILDNNLLPSAFGDEYLPKQIIDGNKANIDAEVIKAIRSDPYFKGKTTPSGLDYIDNDDMSSLGMFPPHLVSLPPNIMERFNYLLSLESQYPGILSGTSDLDYISQKRSEIKQDNQAIKDGKVSDEASLEAQKLDGIFKAVEAIHNNMVIEDHAVNEAYYDKHTSMRDALAAEEQKIINNAEDFRQNYFWGKTKDNQYPMDKGLESLFDDVYTQDEMDKFWGGMTEEEFNKQYRRYTANAWELDKDEINWADGVSEETKAQAEQIIDKQNAGLLESLPYVISERDTQGLDALFGEDDAPEKRDAFKSHATEVTRREKIRSKLGKGIDKVSEKFDGFAKVMGSSSTSAIGKTIDLLGGKFNVALMAATAAMELYNYAFGQWQKSVQEHQTKLSEAQDKVSEAEGNIRESYLKKNPNATQAEADQAVNDAYLKIEDNNYNISALDENTQALYVATYQVQQASALLEKDAMDANFGMNGYFTRISDDLGGMLDMISGNWGTNLVMDSGEFSNAFENSGINVSQGSITDNNNQAVLKGSQSSEDYIYSKENAAIFAADVWEALDLGKEGIEGAKNFFGSDYAHFAEVNRSIFGGDSGFGNSYYTHTIDMLKNNFQNESTQHQLQMFLKNNKQDAQKLAKDIRKFEKANKGKSPISYFTNKKGGKVPNDKALKNLSVRDKELVKYLRSLSIKTGMSAQQLLMAAQLQQMQDLNQIMSEQLQPQVLGLAQNAYQQLAAQQGISGNTNNTSSGAWSTYNAASAIASKLNVLVEQALDVEMQQDYINRGGTNQAYIDNPQNMKKDVIAAFNTPEGQRTQDQKWLVDHYGKNYLQSYYLSGWDTAHPNATPEQREAAMNNYWKNVSQYDSYEKMIGATRKGANAYYTQGLLSAYDASNIGEPASSPSGASGGSGGDDSKDKDKNSGTKKERVDLVLCNKKEIPKLNVNLFKKAPQFTILNKNFKLRDIRINTQDKPKAVLASLKNAIIDTQKRMDPKIIQDEEAEYDPVAATEGNSTPSGSTSTTTD